jgi:hypothetical protein
MATFVLVHGAWGGGWFWKKTIPLLWTAGHTVHATTATGRGDRVHLAGPAVDLDTHITDVANVLEFEELTDVHRAHRRVTGLSRKEAAPCSRDQRRVLHPA